MKKITVRHYLNAKIKPKKEQNKDWYPVYVQIIYNKFSTDKRSVSEIYMTEKGFDYYSNTSKLKKGEIMIFRDNTYSLELMERILSKEIIDIECSIRLIDKTNFKASRKNILYIINEFSKEAYSVIKEQHSLDREVYIAMGEPNEYDYNTDYEEFLHCFNGNINDCFATIKKFTGIDLMPFLKEETIIEYESLNLLYLILKELNGNYKMTIPPFLNYTSFAEFFCMDYKPLFKERLKDKSVEYYDKVISEIEKMAESCMIMTYQMCS